MTRSFSSFISLLSDMAFDECMFGCFSKLRKFIYSSHSIYHNNWFLLDFSQPFACQQLLVYKSDTQKQINASFSSFCDLFLLEKPIINAVNWRFVEKMFTNWLFKDCDHCVKHFLHFPVVLSLNGSDIRKLQKSFAPKKFSKALSKNIRTNRKNGW